MTGISYKQRLLNEAKALGAYMPSLLEEVEVKAHAGTWTEVEALEKFVEKLRIGTANRDTVTF